MIRADIQTPAACTRSREKSRESEAGVDAGLCTVFIRHTSASLIIQENADPSEA